MRLLSHPRFRAAFDFLVLRLSASSEHAEDVAFWREAQAQSPEALASALVSAAGHPDEEGGPQGRRRRRRRRRSSAASPE